MPSEIKEIIEGVLVVASALFPIVNQRKFRADFSGDDE